MWSRCQLGITQGKGKARGKVRIDPKKGAIKRQLSRPSGGRGKNENWCELDLCLFVFLICCGIDRLDCLKASHPNVKNSMVWYQNLLKQRD